MRKIVYSLLLIFVYALFGCSKEKKKQFLYLGGIVEDSEMKLEYKAFEEREDNLFVSFDIMKYDSSIEYIRKISVSDEGKIIECYYNGSIVDEVNKMKFEEENVSIDLILSKESKNEYLNIQIYQHELVTLYLSDIKAPSSK